MSIVKVDVKSWDDFYREKWGYPYYPYYPWGLWFYTINNTNNTGENTDMYDFKATSETYTYTLDVPGAISTEVTRVKQDEIQLKGVRDGRTISHNWLLPEDALFSEAKATYHLGVLKVVVPRKVFKASTLNVQWL